MIPRPLIAALLGLAVSSAAQAEEDIELNNIYPTNSELFMLSDRAFYTQDNKGHFEVVKGPFEEGPARCIGSGFVLKDGVTDVEGICIFGEADNSFTMKWEAGAQGAANAWTIVSGTGRYEGMTGAGIATSGVEILYRAMPMRQTHIIGKVTLAGQ